MLFDDRQIDKTKLKNQLLKEYFSFKDTNSDSILLFQIGDFYETFFNDAKIFSEITGAILGSRTIKEYGDIAQTGVPIYSATGYIKQLLDKNYKVCICAQFKNQDNECYRKIIRTYTKGTVIESDFLDSTENNFILALYLKDDFCSLSYADVSEGQFYKTKDTLKQILMETEKISPNEILVSKNQYEIFKDKIKQFNITVLDDEYFDFENIENAILKYCKSTQKEFLAKLDKIIEYKINTFLFMDEVTRRNLELTRTKRFLKKKGSVYWFLNYTKTPMGARLLKKYLSEPLLDIKEIEKRQNAVEELISKSKYIPKISEILEQFCDLSRMCARLSNTTIYPKDLLQVVNSSSAIEDLCKICAKLNSPLLKINKNKLEEIIELALNIKKAIKPNPPQELKCGEIIQDGYDSGLDYLRKKFKKLQKDISNYELHEKKRLNIEKLKISYNSIIGYYIEVPAAKQNSLSEEYLKKQALTSCIRCTTDKLKNYEIEFCNLKYKINELEYEIYCNIRKKASVFVETIRDLAKDIARIDVLNSYSRCAIENKLSRPFFNSGGLSIIDGFHPSLIKLKNEIVKNDTHLDNSNMMILTGANMSGKSTYLKHNAIICILSQMGCFVPAKSANLTIVDKIILRQGSTDDIINNNSSFMVEMNDLKFILDNVTNASLILLDEPAKSTSEKEGSAIALAFCEYLLNYYSAKTILVTHSTELTKLEKFYPKRALNYVIGKSDTSEYEIIDRKLKRGVVSSSLAINTAILAQLPDEIIKSAKEIYKKM